MSKHSPKFQAIIFDMDGLLVDSEPVWAIAERALVEMHGGVYDIETQKQFIGLGTHVFVGKMREVYNLSATAEELFEILVDSMVKIIPEKTLPRPGAPEMIDYVVTHNLPRAIASSSPRAVVDAIVASQGWDEIIVERVGGNQVKHTKPAPDLYLKAAELLGVSPQHCLALEDSPTGAKAAIAAGMTCYAVPDPYHSTVSAFEGITPYVFDSLHDVRRSLEVNS
jgi:HAD superfamily hydrolase (TIGR01509 family)